MLFREKEVELHFVIGSDSALIMMETSYDLLDLFWVPAVLCVEKTKVASNLQPEIHSERGQSRETMDLSDFSQKLRQRQEMQCQRVIFS